MPDLPPANGDLTALVPQGLLRRLKAHFRESIAEAVQRYRFNETDEAINTIIRKTAANIRDFRR